MSEILNKINKILNNATEIVNSGDDVKRIGSGLVKTAIVAAISAQVALPNIAYACSGYEHNYSQEHITILGESKVVTDHVHETMRNTGISLDTNSQYLNHENPFYSKMNDFIFHSSKSMSAEEFEDLIAKVKIAQRHFNNGQYKGLDSYSHHLLPLLNDKPTYVINHDSVRSADLKFEEVSAVNDIFHMMKDDPTFQFDDIDRSRITKELVSNNSSEIRRVGGIDVISNHAEGHGGGMTGMMSLMGISDGGSFDFDDAWEYKEFIDEHFYEAVTKAYELTDLDLKLLNNSVGSHEIGHKINVNGDSSKTEFVAQSSAIWNLMKSGGSDNAAQYLIDQGVLNYGLHYSEDTHASIGLIDLYFKTHTSDEWRSMDLKEFIYDVTKFIDHVDNDYSGGNNLPAAGYYAANEKLQIEGAYPKLQEYLNKTGEYPELAEYLSNSDEVAQSRFNPNEQVAKTKASLKWKDNAFMSAIVMPFTSFNVDDHPTLYDEDANRELFRKLNKNYSEGHFEKVAVGDLPTDYTKAESILPNVDKFKISEDMKLYTQDHKGFSEVVDLAYGIETETHSNGDISFYLYDEEGIEEKIEYRLDAQDGFIDRINHDGEYVAFTAKDMSNFEYNDAEGLMKIAKQNWTQLYGMDFETHQKREKDLANIQIMKENGYTFTQEEIEQIMSKYDSKQFEQEPKSILDNDNMTQNKNQTLKASDSGLSI